MINRTTVSAINATTMAQASTLKNRPLTYFPITRRLLTSHQRQGVPLGGNAGQRRLAYYLNSAAASVMTEAIKMTTVATMVKYFWKELLAYLPISALLLVNLIR